MVQEHRTVLWNEPDTAHDLGCRELVWGGTVQIDRAPYRRTQPDQLVEQRRLAGTVAAHQGHHLAPTHLEVDPPQDEE